MPDVNRLVEAVGVPATIALVFSLLVAWAIQQYIVVRKKKALVDLDQTVTVERREKLNKTEQLSLLQTQYEELKKVAKIHQDTVEELRVQVEYLTPIADRAERAEESYDLLKGQNKEQADEIHRLNELAEALEKNITRMQTELDICLGVIRVDNPNYTVTTVISPDSSSPLEE